MDMLSGLTAECPACDARIPPGCFFQGFFMSKIANTRPPHTQDRITIIATETNKVNLNFDKYVDYCTMV